jgi:hypothetical protein
MGILDDAKRIADEISGKAERQRQQEATQKAQAQEAEAARAKAEQAKQVEAEKARAQAAEKSRDERQQNGPPAARMAAQVIPGQEDRLRQERQQKPEPVKAPEIPPREAERMKYQPTGHQRGPSPGGSNYFNPLAHKAVESRQQQQSQQAQAKREPTMIEKFQERQKAEGQDRSAQVQKQTREQQIQALNKELGR